MQFRVPTSHDSTEEQLCAIVGQSVRLSVNIDSVSEIIKSHGLEECLFHSSDVQWVKVSDDGVGADYLPSERNLRSQVSVSVRNGVTFARFLGLGADDNVLVSSDYVPFSAADNDFSFDLSHAIGSLPALSN